MRAEAAQPVVYETKPATEWLLGGPVQKVSPRYAHGLMQRLVAERLGAWAERRGRVATEWRVWVTPGQEYARYLVPDVAFISYERLPRAAREAAEEPYVTPEAVFEIRSKDDRKIHVEHKVDVYLRAGCDLMCILDPYERRLVAHDRERVTIVGSDEDFTHPALPGFVLSLPELFAKLDE